MAGFFRSLSEFLESDLAKSHGWIILISFVICIFISWILMWFFFVKIIVPSKAIKANNAIQDNKIRSC